VENSYISCDARTAPSSKDMTSGTVELRVAQHWFVILNWGEEAEQSLVVRSQLTIETAQI